MYRTHTCGELRTEHIGQQVTLCGWVDRIRDHKYASFIDMRDRYGLTQVVVMPDADQTLIDSLKKMASEYVIQVTGTVIARQGEVNPKMPTGEIEIQPSELKILNESKALPFLPGSMDPIGEDVRLEHRFVDLRRQSMQDALILRHRISKIIRDYFDSKGFIDVETPILGRSTPEGARDYLVPSRVHPGSFFALPQSPQLYKQIMMIAGYDRYFQIARCFRDEDLRADRQPEFTQLDMEMSFVELDDVIQVIDGLMVKLAKEVLGIELSGPLPRMTYDEAMRRFGHDAPDLRFGLEIVDCTELAKKSGFNVFQSVAEGGGFVRGLCVKGGEDLGRRKIDALTKLVREDFGAKGLAWVKVGSDGWTGPVAKNMPEEEHEAWTKQMGAETGDLLLFIADSWSVSCKSLYGLRKQLGAERNLYNPKEMHFSWVTDFPMFEKDEESGSWHAMHHPFTAANDEDLEKLDSDPSAARAKAYDLVINGFEAGGGTIRIHQQDIQAKIFQLLGLSDEMANDRFGFLLEALKCGAPPHGGIALGIDRIIMLFGGYENIREVIAFPKTQKAMDLMTGAPGQVDQPQLEELFIQTTAEKTESEDS